MIEILSGLRMEKNIDNGFFRPSHDGIFSNGNGIFVISFCHGCKDGRLELEIGDYIYPVEPKDIRRVLKDKTGYSIPNKKKLILFPCFPNAVICRYEQELKDNNITIAGNWKSATIFRIYKKHMLVGRLETVRRNYGKPFTFVMTSKRTVKQLRAVNTNSFSNHQV